MTIESKRLYSTLRAGRCRCGRRWRWTWKH
nr:MAG TPA: hypothetical protein [Caudoviricetes sp.]